MHHQIEIEPGAHDVSPQHAILPGLRYCLFKALHSQGILFSDIDETLSGADGVCSYDHALYNAVGIRLYYAAVHESSRVSLVGVADYVGGVAGAFHGFDAGFPFQTGGEAASPTASDAAAYNFPYHFFRFPGSKYHVCCLVTAEPEVVLDPLRVDHSLVTEGEKLLLLEEGNVLHVGDRSALILVQKPFNGPASQKVAVDYLVEVFMGDLLVEYALRLHHHYGPLGAETVAPCGHHQEPVGKAPFGHFYLQGFRQAEGLVRHAGGSGTDHKCRRVAFVGLEGFPLSVPEFFYGHVSPPL